MKNKVTIILPVTTVLVTLLWLAGLSCADTVCDQDASGLIFPAGTMALEGTSNETTLTVADFSRPGVTAKIDDWRAKAAMPTGRWGLTAATVDGVVYAIGGRSSDSNHETAVEAYDPVTNSWSAKAPMPTGRHALAAAVVDGVIYVIGGQSYGAEYETANEAYDPVTNSWSTRAPMPTARRFLAAVPVNGVIYAIGGDSSDTAYETAVEAYDPATNSWSTKESMPTGRQSSAAAAVDGVVYVIGGYASGNFYQTINEAYDPVTNSWSAKAPMPTGRHALAAAAVDGVIYAIGGWKVAYSQDNEAYDPITDSWVTRAPMPTGRSVLAAAVVDEVIYAIGGEYPAAVHGTANEAYTAALPVYRVYLPLVVNRWPSIPDPPVLNPIDNSDQDNDYTVGWIPSDLANTYILEEATHDTFSDAQIVYQGSGLAWTTSSPGKTPSHYYYYRVKGRNSWGDSAWSKVQTVAVYPLFVGLQLRWDGAGYLRGDWYYDVGHHLTIELTGLTDADIVKSHGYEWYDPNPTGFSSETWDTYYSVSTGYLRSSSAPADPSWKWGTSWILPYDLPLYEGQELLIDGQPFSVSGPHWGYTAWGQAVQYWQIVNKTRFLYWDGGGDWRQYVHPGDITLWYEAGKTRLELRSDVLRREYYQDQLTRNTVQYIINLTYSNSFSEAGALADRLEIPKTWGSDAFNAQDTRADDAHFLEFPEALNWQSDSDVRLAGGK
jgi:N-acetylneuraminic acid mutarotase